MFYYRVFIIWIYYDINNWIMTKRNIWKWKYIFGVDFIFVIISFEKKDINRL